MLFLSCVGSVLILFLNLNDCQCLSVQVGSLLFLSSGCSRERLGRHVVSVCCGMPPLSYGVIRGPMGMVPIVCCPLCLFSGGKLHIVSLSGVQQFQPPRRLHECIVINSKMWVQPVPEEFRCSSPALNN